MEEEPVAFQVVLRVEICHGFGGRSAQEFLGLLLEKLLDQNR